jgi:hypothetical protein
MRRLRAGFVTPLPGGLGQPSVPTKGDCLEWLDAAWTKGGESCPDQGGRSLPVRARKHGPGDRKAAWSAERRPRSPQWSAATDDLVRRLALHFPRLMSRAGRGNTAPPRRSNNRGVGACPTATSLFDIFIGPHARACFRSSPRKRPRSANMQVWKIWMPAFAGTNGERSAIHVRHRHSQ